MPKKFIETLDRFSARKAIRYAVYSIAVALFFLADFIAADAWDSD